jgi:hypothetical protein
MMIANVPASAARRACGAFPRAGERPEEELGNFRIVIPKWEAQYRPARGTVDRLVTDEYE